MSGFAPATHTGQPPSPGDWFVTEPAGDLFRWIGIGEQIIDRKQIRQRKRTGKPAWGHSGVASRYINGQLYIVEAEPGGAVERPWHWGDRPYLWSTGTGLSNPSMALRAMAYAGYVFPAAGMDWEHRFPGVGYSFLDYAAIETHALHIPVPGLQEYIASTGHMICSQLTDQCALDTNVHLFDDGRWPGFVKPLDLGMLLEDHGARYAGH